MSDPVSTPAPQTPQSAAGAPPAAKPRKKKKRRLLRALLVLLLLGIVAIVLVVALLPTILSTGAGTNFVERIAQSQVVKGTVDIQDLSLSWGGPIEVRGASVYSADGAKVVELGEAKIAAGVWALARGAMKSEFDLGTATARGSLPLVKVYPDGTTNLHETMPVVFEPSDPNVPTPKVYGDFTADFDVTAQRYEKGANGKALGDAVEVLLSDAKVAMAPGGAVDNDVTLAFRVAAKDAGKLAIKGNADLENLTADEAITLNGLDLAAMATAAAAFLPEPLPVRVEGVGNGTLTANTATGALGGELVFTNFKTQTVPSAATTNPADAPTTPTVWDAGTLTLAVDGAFDQAKNVATINSLTLDSTNDGRATLGAVADLAAIQKATEGETPNVAALITAVTGVKVDVATKFATVKGTGETLAALNLDYTADLDQLKARFGDAVRLGTIDASGVITGTYRSRANGGALQVAIDTSADNLVLVDTAPVELGGAAKPPLNVAKLASKVVASLQLGETMSIPEATVTLSASDAQGEVFTLDAKATGIDQATQSIKALQLATVSIPDYPRAQKMLAGWADLPEATSSPGPLNIEGTLSWDGTARKAQIAKHLTFTADGKMLATVAGEATLPEQGAYAAGVVVDAHDLSNVRNTLMALGLMAPDSPPLSGRMRIALPGVTFDPAAEVAAKGLLAENGEMSMVKAQYQGLTIDGKVPLRVANGVFEVPQQASPLKANRGNVSLAGLSVNLETMRLTVPEGMLVDGVELNPVLANAFGQYLNPVLTEPEEANGFVQVKVTRAANLNLSDPLGPEGGQLTMSFAVKDLFIDNDIIGEMANQLGGQVVDAVNKNVGLLGAVPDVRAKVQQFTSNLNLSEEVKEEVSSFRGNIAESTVAIDNGTASSTIQFNIFDPRKAATETTAADLYAVTFAGKVNMKSKAIEISTNVPVNLLEKWVDDDSADLVKLFGEQPVRKFAPNGVTVHLRGTSFVPVPDVMQSLNSVLPNAFRAAATKQADDFLKKGLQKGLDDLFGGGD